MFFFNKNRKRGCINRLCTAIHYISEGRYKAETAQRQTSHTKSISQNREHKIASELQTKRVVKTLTNCLHSRVQKNIIYTKFDTKTPH